MRGRLEREIRLLPQVLSCSVTSDDVVVLIAPSAEASAVEAQVREIVVGSGALMGVRVIGGYERAATAIFRLSLPSHTALRGALVGAGAVAVLALVGGVSTTHPPAASAPPAVVAVPDPGARAGLDGLVFRPVVGAGGVVAAEPPVALMASRTAASGSALSASRAPSHVSEVARVAGSLEPRAVSVTSCRTAPDRGAPLPRHRSASRQDDHTWRTHDWRGPRAWSRSILVAPHDACEHGHP